MRTPAVSAILAFTFAALLNAQTATTGLISGSVTDPSGAVVPTAVVELTSAGTGLVQKQTVNAAGQYVFPNVQPGDFQLKVSAQGFRTATVGGIHVDVTKSYVQDIRLEVGQVAETVEVTAGTKIELQTVDSTVGTIIPGQALPTM